MSIDTGAIEEKTQITTLVKEGYQSKVDAVVLEITALPSDLSSLADAIMLFSRRFEQDGFMM